MKEKFNEKIDKVLRKVLDIPPELEDLLANFPHAENCSKSKSLDSLDKVELVEINGRVFDNGWISLPVVRVTNKYLECGECHIQKRYID